MKNFLTAAAVCFAALMYSPSAHAQTPDGSDISKAIPITLGQTISDIGDAKTSRNHVYKIVLAKGQQFNVVATSTSATVSGLPSWGVWILPSTVTSLGTISSRDALATTGCCGDDRNGTAWTLNYQVAATGTYYILVFYGSNTNGAYTLQVSAQGTPIAVPNPTTAGCLTGRVDYLTYSLQFIAAGLPDEVSIGGTKACATCNVKAPLYPEIATKLESALKSNLNAEACYDSTGNIFQVKLVHP